MSDDSYSGSPLTSPGTLKEPTTREHRRDTNQPERERNENKSKSSESWSLLSPKLDKTRSISTKENCTLSGKSLSDLRPQVPETLFSGGQSFLF